MKYVILLIAVFYAGAGNAGTDAATEDEKRYLIKIAQELKQLEILAAKAANKADPDARVTLDYVALRHDLLEMQRALETHINRPSRTPRKIEALTLAGNR